MPHRFTVDVGPERAAQFATNHLERANDILIEDLGDGRIRFDQEALNWYREQYTEIDNGYVQATDAGHIMWVDGDALPVLPYPPEG